MQDKRGSSMIQVLDKLEPRLPLKYLAININLKVQEQSFSSQTRRK
jgi:hypothetical protein